MKTRTNVSIDSRLFESARRLGFSLSGILEDALKEHIKIREEAAWKEENREAIESYKASIEEEGVFSDGLRTF